MGRSSLPTESCSEVCREGSRRPKGLGQRRSLELCGLTTPLPSPPPKKDLLEIAIRKGIRSTRNPSPHYTALSYHRLSQPFYTCLSSISSVSIPKSVGDALAHPGWRQAMLDEMNAFQNNGTWELVPLPSRKSVVGCRWVFAIKVGPYGTIDSQSSSCG